MLLQFSRLCPQDSTSKRPAISATIFQEGFWQYLYMLSSLGEMSHGILKRCYGFPLAIITMASLLAGKPTKDQWEQVYNSISCSFSHQGMRDILLLSYYDLPQHLKTCFLYLSMFPEDCFLYLSMFPEDYLIEREELTWRWIAEGFITEVRGQTVDQVAENYFNELVNRSLIQPIGMQYDGRAEACRVHDMVLELILSLSAEENFASIVEGQIYNGGGHKIRRLLVQSEHVGDDVMQDIKDKWSQVRSISFYGLQGQGILHHLQELHCLRVLVFNDSNYLGNQPVKYIGSLSQLTFLSFGIGHITELPDDIGDLQHLQTLDIRYNGITKLPPSIGRLQKLARLLVDLSIQLPEEIGNLKALQELFTLKLSIKLMEVLTHLTKLKMLGIYVPDREQLGHDTGRYVEALKSSLVVMGKQRLQSLDIINSDFLREELMDILCFTFPCVRKLGVHRNGITRVPKQAALLVNLTHLSLLVLRIEQEDLCNLGGIPALIFSELFVVNALMNGLPLAARTSGASRSLSSAIVFTEVVWRCCSYRKRCQSSKGCILNLEHRKQSLRWGLSSASSTLQAWSTSSSRCHQEQGGGCGSCCQECCQHPPRTSST